MLRFKVKMRKSNFSSVDGYQFFESTARKNKDSAM